MAENISFSEENNGKKPNCKLKCLKRASRVNLLDQRLNVDIYSIYIYRSNMQTLQGQDTTEKTKTDLKLCDRDGAGENQ